MDLAEEAERGKSGITAVKEETVNKPQGDQYRVSAAEDSPLEENRSVSNLPNSDADRSNGDFNEKSPAKEGLGSPAANDVVIQMIGPHSLLPTPEAPPGVLAAASEQPPVNRSRSLPQKTAVDMPAIGKFIRDKSNSFSTAIAKRLSSLKDDGDGVSKPNWTNSNVTEFNLSGLKVIVKLKTVKDDVELFQGRITFFSRSNCRDCGAVRSYFRERGLKFVEINTDVFPMREKELVERTGSSAVPQIFFNEKLYGGLVALNSMRNSGILDQRLREMLGSKCPHDAPAPPVYGFDDPEEERMDEMVGIVRVLRQRVPIQDRLTKMKIVKNCFNGAEMVEAIIQHLDCGRKKVSLILATYKRSI